MKTKVPVWASVLVVAVIFVVVGFAFWWYTGGGNEYRAARSDADMARQRAEDRSRRQHLVLSDDAGKVKIIPKDGAKMVWVPAGEFLMGTTDAQANAARDDWPGSTPERIKFVLETEKPQHKVYLDGYWIYKYEVTMAQYRKFVTATRRANWNWVKDVNYPITNVTWQDAADYAKWAGVSLPTEAQWERAARGPDGRIYPWGDMWDGGECVYNMSWTRGGPESVGTCPSGASPYGCLDMAGNVSEWCADWFDPDYYKSGPLRNPTGPSKPVEFSFPNIRIGSARFPDIHMRSARVERGGSWHGTRSVDFRCSSRGFSEPEGRGDYTGFRCAMAP